MRRIFLSLEKAMQIVSRCGDGLILDGVLKGFPKRLLDNKLLMLLAVDIDGRALSNASERLKNDKELAMAAAENFWGALQFVSEELMSDKEFTMDLMRRLGPDAINIIFVYASKEVKNDKDVLALKEELINKKRNEVSAKDEQKAVKEEKQAESKESQTAEDDEIERN